VKIGRNTNVQDNVTLVNSVSGSGSTIGDDVVIGTSSSAPAELCLPVRRPSFTQLDAAPGAHLDSVTIDDGAMIGMGARLGAGVKVGKDSFVDAGCVVPQGTEIPAGQLWTGSPARHLRDLSVDEMAYLRTQALSYGQVASRHADQHAKTLEEVDYDSYLKDWREWNYMAPEDPLPQVAPEMVEYYTLTRAQSMAVDQGIFRTKEYNDDVARQAQIADEDAADRAEEEYHQNVATLDTVYDGVKQLTETRVSRAVERDAVLAHIASVDVRAAVYLHDLLARVHEAAGDEAAQSALRDELYNLDPAVWEAAKGADTQAQLATLAAHAAAMAKGEGAALQPGALAELAASLDPEAGDVAPPTPKFAAGIRERPTRGTDNAESR